MGFLDSVFSSKSKKKRFFEFPTKIDLHSHLIPGIDDGVQSLDESIELIQRFIEMGYTKIITTPHIMSDFYKNTPEVIKKGLEDVKAELKKRELNIEIEAAAEYYVDEKFMEKIGKEELLTFGDNYILIESNTINYSDIIRNAVWELNLAGYKPVYAHPERYTYYWKNFNAIHRIKDMGILFQINLPSLAGFYNQTVQKFTEKLIENNMVEFIGSDAHEMRYLESLNNARKNKAMEKLASANLLNDTL